jgi:N-acetylglutamate synthase-like GNAT family acetyltransferase
MSDADIPAEQAPGETERRRTPATVGGLDASGVAFLVRPAAPGDASAVDVLVSTLRDAGALPPSLCRDDIAASEPAGRGTRGGHDTVLVAEQLGGLVGVARYRQIAGSTEATVAVAVKDLPERREVAVELVSTLALAAHERGIEHFVADLLTQNAAVLAVFVRAGFETEIDVGDGTMHMRMSLDPQSRREGRSAVRAAPIWSTSDTPYGQELEARPSWGAPQAYRTG